MNTAAPHAAAPAEADVGSVSARSPESDRRFALAVTATFAAILAVLTWRHAPWRDELQAWAIARDNPSITDLVHQLRYEGHPALWYLVLWLPARISRGVAALAVVHWTLAVAAAGLWMAKAPFSRTARVVIVFSYFPLFEYGVIARSYVLVWLLALVALTFVRHRLGLVVLGVAMMLMANTTVLAVPLAVALTIGVIVDRATHAPTAPRWSRMFAGSAVALGAATALLTARPAPDAAHSTVTFAFDRSRLLADLIAPLRALAPIPGATVHFWDTSLADHAPWLGALVAIGLVIAGAWIVRTSRAALITWLLPALAVPALLYTRDLYASMRFCGVLFVAAVAALWLARQSDTSPLAAERAIRSIGAVGCAASTIAVVLTATTPFTGAAATARWIRDNVDSATPIVCDTAYRCSAVGIRLDRPTAAADTDGPFTYAVFRSREVQGDAVAAAVAAARTTGRPVVLLTTERPDDPRVEVRIHVGRSVVADERYWISLVNPTGS